MLVRLLRALRERSSRRRKKVDFYSSTWIDEIWVRSAILAMRGAGFATRMIISGDRTGWPADLPARYAAADIPLEWAPSVPSLNSLACRVVVTASSGVPRDYFGASLRRLIHMPHSLASLHAIYEANAFDGYDTLFAAGPHHTREFEALGRANGLGPRIAFAAGYGKFDVMRAEAPKRGAQSSRRVLVAPSWGEKNLLSLIGLQLVSQLVDSSWTVVLRPHPSFFLSPDTMLDAILNQFSGDSRVEVERSTGGSAALWTANAVIADYSGFALEFAALRRRACLFVDGPRKILNRNWEALGLPAAEIEMRNELGLVVATSPEAISAGLERLAVEPELEPACISRFLYDEPDVGSRVLKTLANEISEVGG